MHLIEITPQLRFPWTTALHLFPSKDAFILIVSYVFQNMEVLHLMVFGCFWMFPACRKPRLGPGHKLMSTSELTKQISQDPEVHGSGLHGI
jgi:hypothetical protein